MAVSQIGWEGVNESALLTLFPMGSGLKLGPLPEGHYMMVVFWTLVENTQSYMCFMPRDCCQKAKGQTQPITLKRYPIAAESPPEDAGKNGILTKYFVITAKTSIPFQMHL